MSTSSPGLIVGVVIDEEGRPLAEAAVSVGDAPVPVPDIAALTGPDGRFSLPAPVPGSYTVAARAPGYSVGSAIVQVDVERSAEAQVEVRLARE